MNDTYWAIRLRERANREGKAAAATPKGARRSKAKSKAKAEQTKAPPTKAAVVLTDADAEADLVGEPRPDNPTLTEEDPGD